MVTEPKHDSVRNCARGLGRSGKKGDFSDARCVALEVVPSALLTLFVKKRVISHLGRPQDGQESAEESAVADGTVSYSDAQLS